MVLAGDFWVGRWLFSLWDSWGLDGDSKVRKLHGIHLRLISALRKLRAVCLAVVLFDSRFDSEILLTLSPAWNLK